VLADVVPLLRCPLCSGGLAAAGPALRCSGGHSFDVARQGYVSLLAGAAGAGTGDTAPMVAAREAFLATGAFAPLAEELAAAAAAAVATAAAAAAAVSGDPGREPGPVGAVVDVGAGTGYYLARVLERLPGRPGLALDLSKPALRRAARAHPRIGAVACDAWRGLPVRTGTAAVVLGVFAPRNAAEAHRVLQPGGALIVATPAPEHLRELVDLLGLIDVDARKAERLQGQLAAHFTLAGRTGWKKVLRLTAEQAETLVAMGPSSRHVDLVRVRDRLRPLDPPLPVTASVSVSVYRRRDDVDTPAARVR
jgi:23S rRNA (guanine745-N1)-methyltransferase